MASPTVKIATASDEEPSIDALVLAFSADPVARWVWPESRQYLQHFPDFVRAFGGHAFANRSAYYVEGYPGASLWLPPDVHPDDEAVTDILRRSVFPQSLEVVFAIFEAMGRYHPSEPHWYLPLIGVDPAHQGRGHGSALLRHAVVACDRDRKLAYLESTNPRNVPLYERHGFAQLGTIQVGSAPPLFPMLRKPG